MKKTKGTEEISGGNKKRKSAKEATQAAGTVGGPFRGQV